MAYSMFMLKDITVVVRSARSMSTSSTIVLSPVVTSTPIRHATRMSSGFHIKIIRHRIPATKLLVDEAFNALNSRHGVSLQKIKRYIADTYHIDVSAQRYGRMKNYLRELQTAGAVVNVTGKGLVGHLRRLSNRRASKAHSSKSTPRPTVSHRRQQLPEAVAADGMSTPPDQSIKQLEESLRNAPAVRRDPLAHTNSIVNSERGDTPRTSLRGRPQKRHLLPAVGDSEIFELEEQLSPVVKRRKKRKAK